MKNVVRTMLLASTIGLGIPAASAAPLSGTDMRVTAPEPIVEQVQSDRYCRRLRRACEFKQERGEAGEGNCRRYRRECRRSWR